VCRLPCKVIIHFLVARLLTVLASLFPRLIVVPTTDVGGGGRPTIDPVVVGRAAHEATGFDKDAPNRSIKLSVPTMGPNYDFKEWKRKFLTFLSLKAAYLIPHMTIRESGV
jgi:hypothetical protein